jgi:hypothetical protein
MDGTSAGDRAAIMRPHSGQQHGDGDIGNDIMSTLYGER